MCFISINKLGIHVLASYQLDAEQTGGCCTDSHFLQDLYIDQLQMQQLIFF